MIVVQSVEHAPIKIFTPELTIEEVKSGYSLSFESRLVLQDLLSKAVEEFLLVVLDGKQSAEAVAYRQSYLKGQIDLMRHLLAYSDVTVVETFADSTTI